MRWEAAKALARLGDAQGLDLLLAALGDGEQQTRAAAEEALRELLGKGAVDEATRRRMALQPAPPQPVLMSNRGENRSSSTVAVTAAFTLPMPLTAR